MIRSISVLKLLFDDSGAFQRFHRLFPSINVECSAVTVCRNLQVIDSQWFTSNGGLTMHFCIFFPPQRKGSYLGQRGFGQNDRGAVKDLLWYSENFSKSFGRRVSWEKRKRLWTSDGAGNNEVLPGGWLDVFCDVPFSCVRPSRVFGSEDDFRRPTF